jgi:EAL domain-containing protein (putative c-di-GMP-specific phosphodiesterase class I)
MLDMIVLIAMAVTAVAFAVGLVVHAGIPLLPGVIAAAALYLVMAASYLMLARGSRSSGEGERVRDLEEALEIIDADLQRIDRVEDDVARLELLNDRVERLDQAVSEHGTTGAPAGMGRLEDVTAEFENVYSRIEGLRGDLQSEARGERDKIASDLKALENLIKRISRDLTNQGNGASAEPEPAKPARAGFLGAAPEKPATTSESAEPITLFEEELPTEVVEEKAEEPALADDKMRALVRQAVEAGRVDLYLQPIVALEERKLRFYEGLTRIRDASDDLILPGTYLPVAERTGQAPLIDNVLLVKSVQVLRRLGADSRIKGIFCNISMHSLLDVDFFPELVEFLEENSGLAESLMFEIKQPQLQGLTRAELGCLDTLGALGYGFSLDHVADLDLDLTGLRDRYFRYLKVDARTFLHGMEDGGAPVPASDMKAYLEEFDIKLIVEKVEKEGDVARLLDYGVELAQGHLFGEPKPMSPALFRELEDADAA